jgi:hypothetical protein
LECPAHPGSTAAAGLIRSCYLRLLILDNEDTFIDLLNKITKEYCSAFEHLDLWSSIDLCQIDFDIQTVRSLEKDTEPAVLIHESRSDILGRVYFPRSRFSPGEMQLFSEKFLAFIDTLVEMSLERVQEMDMLR